MLESLFNKVAGLQDRFYFSLAKTLKNSFNFLINYVVLIEPSRTSTIELFSLWLSHILKTYLIPSIAFRFHFLQNFGSLLLTIEHFFSKFEITQWKVLSIKEVF